jgi:hypothetical protein
MGGRYQYDSLLNISVYCKEWQTISKYTLWGFKWGLSSNFAFPRRHRVGFISINAIQFCLLLTRRKAVIEFQFLFLKDKTLYGQTCPSFFTKHHALTCGWKEVQLHAFSTSALDRDGPVSCPDPFTAVNSWIEIYVGPKAGLDVVAILFRSYI